MALNAQELGKFVAYRDAVLIFPFIEGRGTKLHDFSRHRNHGTIHGATWTQGKFGKALSFDGIDDYVDCGNDESLDITDAITIAAWVKPVVGDVSKTILGKVSFRTGYMMYQAEGKRYQVYLGNGSDWVAWGGTYSFVDNKWTHIAFTASMTDSKLRLYVDGVQHDSFDISSPWISSKNPFKIGKGEYGTGSFNGTIDEVRIYNRALSEEEIKCLYLNSFKKPKPTCVTRRGVYQAVKNEGIELTGNSLKCVEAMV